MPFQPRPGSGSPLGSRVPLASPSSWGQSPMQECLNTVLLASPQGEYSFFTLVLKLLPSPPRSLTPAYSSGLDSNTSQTSLWPQLSPHRGLPPAGWQPVGHCPGPASGKHCAAWWSLGFGSQLYPASSTPLPGHHYLVLDPTEDTKKGVWCAPCPPGAAARRLRSLQSARSREVPACQTPPCSPPLPTF